MSDIRLYNINKKKELKPIKVTKGTLQEMIEANSFDLLGVTVILSNVNLSGKNGEIIETLGYDEDRRLVVMEYHTGKFAPTINKGLEHLDYIRQNIGKVKVLLKEKLGSSDFIYDPRLICIGEEFNEYDGKAIRFLPFDIDLIKYQIFGKDVIALEKIYQNFVDSNKDFSGDHDINRLYLRIDEIAYSFGDELAKSFLGDCASYRRIKNFMYVYYKDAINVVLKINGEYKKYIVKKEEDIEKITPFIEMAYDEN